MLSYDQESRNFWKGDQLRDQIYFLGSLWTFFSQSKPTPSWQNPEIFRNILEFILKFLKVFYWKLAPCEKFRFGDNFSITIYQAHAIWEQNCFWLGKFLIFVTNIREFLENFAWGFPDPPWVFFFETSKLSCLVIHYESIFCFVFTKAEQNCLIIPYLCMCQPLLRLQWWPGRVRTLRKGFSTACRRRAWADRRRGSSKWRGTSSGNALPGIRHDRLLDLVVVAGGTIYHVSFKIRQTGEIRKMKYVCSVKVEEVTQSWLWNWDSQLFKIKLLICVPYSICKTDHR